MLASNSTSTESAVSHKCSPKQLLNKCKRYANSSKRYRQLTTFLEPPAGNFGRSCNKPKCPPDAAAQNYRQFLRWSDDSWQNPACHYMPTKANWLSKQRPEFQQFIDSNCWEASEAVQIYFLLPIDTCEGCWKNEKTRAIWRGLACCCAGHGEVYRQWFVCTPLGY